MKPTKEIRTFSTSTISVNVPNCNFSVPKPISSSTPFVDWTGGTRTFTDYSDIKYNSKIKLYVPPISTGRVYTSGGSNSSMGIETSGSTLSSFKSLLARTSSPHHGLLVPEKIINISSTGLTDSDIGVLAQSLQYQKLDLHLFDFSNNKLGYGAVENIFYTFRYGAPAATFNIRYINLSNNYIDDNGAKYIASHLRPELHPHLKVINVSGNKLTSRGEGYFAKALKNAIVKDIVIHLKLFSGNKKDYNSALKEFLKQAEENGINTKAIASHKSSVSYIKDIATGTFIATWGFIKCKYVLEDFNSFAIDTITAKISNKLAKLISVSDTVQCYLQASNDLWTSELGVKIIKTRS
jgi:hypothetical protein